FGKGIRGVRNTICTLVIELPNRSHISGKEPAMRARTMLVGWTVALAVSTACAAQTGVRAIDVTGLNLGDASGGSVEEPVLISSIDPLDNNIADEQALLAITGQVDLIKENLLYFRW